MSEQNFYMICLSCAERSNVQIEIDTDTNKLKIKCRTCDRKEEQGIMNFSDKKAN